MADTKLNQSGSIRVLCCTANLGNAKPDTDSVSAWIPNDGYCRLALNENPRYPLVTKDMRGKPPPVTCAIPTIPGSAVAAPKRVTSQGSLSRSFDFSNSSLGSFSPRSPMSSRKRRNLSPKTQRKMAPPSPSNDESFSVLELLQPPSPAGGAADHPGQAPQPPMTKPTSMDTYQESNQYSATGSESLMNPRPFLHEQFDIIVIGMQEATFDLADLNGKAVEDVGNDDNFGNDSNDNLDGSGETTTAQPQDPNEESANKLAESMKSVEHPEDLDEVADALADNVKSPPPAKLRKRAPTKKKKRIRSLSPLNNAKGGTAPKSTHPGDKVTTNVDTGEESLPPPPPPPPESPESQSKDFAAPPPPESPESPKKALPMPDAYATKNTAPAEDSSLNRSLRLNFRAGLKGLRKFQKSISSSISKLSAVPPDEKANPAESKTQTTDQPGDVALTSTSSEMPKVASSSSPIIESKSMVDAPITQDNDCNLAVGEDNNKDKGDHRPPPPKKTLSMPLAAGYKAGKATLKASQQAGKATYKVSQQAGKATYKASQQAGKATYNASKQATKVTLYVGKEAGKATIKVSKEATKVATVPIKATMKAGKAMSILATDKDHTDLPPVKYGDLEKSGGGLPNQNPVGRVADIAFPQEYSDTVMLHSLLEDQLPSYTRAVSYQRGEMRLIVYYLESAITMDIVSIKAQNTGRAGLANKGGIFAEVAVNKTTRLAFCTAHLEAHEGSAKYATRCSTIADILRCTEGSVMSPRNLGAGGVGCPVMRRSCRADASLANHFSFFMGDLNFRTRLEGFDPGSAEHVQATHDILDAAMTKISSNSAAGDEGKTVDLSSLCDAYAKLNRADELGHALRVKDCLVGFLTPYCNFPPTFKVHRQFGYSYNEKRSPSYTDRILYRASDRLHDAIQPLLYEPIDSFTTSDHKPIRGAFLIELNNKLKWRPVLTQSSGGTRRLNRANLFRRGGMGAGKSDESTFLQPISQEFVHESLHLFVSSISCQIDRDKLMTKRRTNEYTLEQAPSPYVCFVSTPGDAIHKETFLLTNLRDRVRKAGVKAKKKFMKKKLKKEEGIEMASSVAKKGMSIRMMLEWPRTKKLKNTYRPVWGHDEEVYFKVRTHRQDGVPVDLSGSMLHITLMDGRGGGDGKLIGTFTLNLAKLIEAARNPTSDEHQLTSANNWLSRGNSQRGHSHGASQDERGKTSARKAAQNSLRRLLGNHNHAHDPSEDNMNPPQPRLQQQISKGLTSIMAPLRSGRNSKKSSYIETEHLNEDDAFRGISSTEGIATDRNAFHGSSSFAVAGPSDRLREAMNTKVFASRAAKDARRSLILHQSIVELSPQNSEKEIEFFKDNVGDSPTSGRQALGQRFEDGGDRQDIKELLPGGLDDQIPIQPISDSRLTHRRRSSIFGLGNKGHWRSSIFQHKDASQSNLSHAAEDPMESLKIISIKLDEPLLRNGKEVGRITCNIDAWWMEDNYAKDHHHNHSSELKKSRKKAK